MIYKLLVGACAFDRKTPAKWPTWAPPGSVVELDEAGLDAVEHVWNDTRSHARTVYQPVVIDGDSAGRKVRAYGTDLVELSALEVLALQAKEDE